MARRIGPTAALFAVFFYSGLLHENFSVWAMSGYGLPTLYFIIQGLATWLETPAPFGICRVRPRLGRLWTAAVVLGPVTLLFHEGFRERFVVPDLLVAVAPWAPGDPPTVRGRGRVALPKNQ